MHVGEALERAALALRRYYDTEGNEKEVFSLSIDSDGKGPLKFRVRVLCTVVKECKEEWDHYNKGPFFKTTEEAVGALYRAIIDRIKSETKGWVEEAQAIETKLNQFNEVIAELRRVVGDMGEYLSPQASLPLDEVEEEGDVPDAPEDNGPISAVC